MCATNGRFPVTPRLATELWRSLAVQGAQEIVAILQQNKVITDRYAAIAYIAYSGVRNRLQAGEYLFDRGMTILRSFGKIASGDVYLHKFTIPEGLTTAAIAQKWEQDGFGTQEEFLKAAESALELVRRVDDKAPSVEGYLFPETYSFPKHTTARQAVETMIGRFQQMATRLQQMLPADKWPLTLRETVILASLVETEAAHADERPVIASVYLNRLKRHILLQCDPTVIYALAQEHRYSGKLTFADLKFKSPYNTYTSPGLPPGPYSQPRVSVAAGCNQPAMTNYLFFVRTIESRHTFSETLAAHNRAVAEYRKMKKAS
jgi:UPF0755 protein